MVCFETTCCVVFVIILIMFFTYLFGPTGSMLMRRNGYLVYPYVDLQAPGPDGDQYVLHTCPACPARRAEITKFDGLR